MITLHSPPNLRDGAIGGGMDAFASDLTVIGMVSMNVSFAARIVTVLVASNAVTVGLSIAFVYKKSRFAD